MKTPLSPPAASRPVLASRPAMSWARLFPLASVLLIAAVHAAPLEKDLGFGLVYLRPRELPADLPPKPAGRVPPCVVDLRYAKSEGEAAGAFFAWLKERATTRTPVFVLANAETSLALVQPLVDKPRGSGVVVVGIPSGKFRPHVAAAGSPEAERRAYDALGNGSPVAALLTENPDKVRNDEASLSRDRLAEAAADAVDDAAGKPAPPIDGALQRAVHLHRSLVALRKL